MAAELLKAYESEVPHPDTEHMIHRKRYETMLIGCLPFADQELYFRTLSGRTAMILAGKKGNGKRTLEAAFQSAYGEMFTGLLTFPFALTAQKGEETLAAELKAFLDALAEGSEDEDSEEAYLVSLGEMNPDTLTPRVSAVLTEGIRHIVNDGKGVSIMTAVFDGDVRSLPVELRKSVLLCRVDPPTAGERLSFFAAEMEPLLGYVNDMTGADFMSEYTDGLTFEELHELMQNLQAFLKAKFVVDVAETSGTDISEVEMADIGIDKVNLEKEDFCYLADNYKEAAAPAPALDMSALTEVLSGLTMRLGTEEEKKPAAPSPFALLDDDDDPDDLF